MLRFPSSRSGRTTVGSQLPATRPEELGGLESGGPEIVGQLPGGRGRSLLERELLTDN